MSHTQTITKTTGPAIRIQYIAQKDDRTLAINWTDGQASTFDVVELRRKCPCATCIDEWTHEPILRAADIKDSTRPNKVESVGQYALTIQFDDGHRTGIYTFSYLRQLSKLGIH
jgi:ATP-binding protein involved in chromosome partitioning